MSTKENFLGDLGIEGATVIDANTLLQDYVEGGTEILDKDDESVQKDEPSKEDEKKDDKKDVSFLDTQSSIDELLEDYNSEDDDDEEEEDTKKPEKKVEKKSSKKDEEEDGEPNYFEVMAKNLESIGIFQKDEEDEDDDEEPIEWTEDTFVTKFEDNVKRVANQYLDEAISKYGDRTKSFLEQVLLNGVDPEEYFMSMKSQELVQNFDINTETNQERIMYEYFRLVEPDKSIDEIQEEINDLKGLNKLDKKAEQAKSKLVRYYQAKQQYELQEAQRKQYEHEQQRMIYTQSIQNAVKQAVTQGQIDEIVFDNTDTHDLVEYLVETPYRTVDGKPVTAMYKDFVEAQQDPVKLLKLAKFLKSDLRVEKAVKKAIKEERKKSWDFGVSKKKRTQTPSGRGGFLD